MAFTATGHAAYTVVAAEGELDLNNAPQLRRTLNAAVDAGAANLVMDLTEVQFIDSTTLGVLIGAYNRLRPTGGRLAVACPQEKLLNVFRVTGLDRVFLVRDTVEEAAAGLERTATG